MPYESFLTLLVSVIYLEDEVRLFLGKFFSHNETIKLKKLNL